MKKTFTVNLGGTVFQIDEDAYILLDNYLNNLRFHFRKEEGGEEIVRDIEMRISELFAERMEGGQQVITIDNVESVIVCMGRPEELDNQQDFSEEDLHTEDSCQSTKTAESKVIKRLFRDVDHQVLGGVLSGIAAYFGWDCTALRIVFILLGLSPAGMSMLILYLILMFIIPPARTATEKLQMSGEPVNMENIGKTVTEGFGNDESAAGHENRRTGLQNFLNMIVNIVAFLVKVFLGILVICCIPILIAGFIALFTVVMSVFGLIIHIPAIYDIMMPNIPWNSIMAYPSSGIFFLLSLLLIIGIPLLAVIQVVLQHYGYCKSMSSFAKVCLILIWLIALILGFVLFYNISTLPEVTHF